MKKSLRKAPASQTDVSAFLKQVRDVKTMVTHGTRPGRLAFAIDATASRQPAWDEACRIQGEMFRAAGALGTLEVQLCYFRGFDVFYASPWVADSAALAGEMAGVSCLAGHTQIRRVLRHLVGESSRKPIAAAVYIGDACEEPAPDILGLAGQLRLYKTPLFMFQENSDPRAAAVFEQAAGLSGGAYCRFDAGSAGLLSELLAAVAVYATGGSKAFKALAGGGHPLLQDMSRQLER